MDQNRLKLNQTLEDILGSENVYFQPPMSKKISYPCIIYKVNSADSFFADNRPYFTRVRYQITLIDSNPDSIFFEKILSLPMCTFDRHYATDGLNHYIFNLYW